MSILARRASMLKTLARFEKTLSKTNHIDRTILDIAVYYIENAKTHGDLDAVPDKTRQTMREYADDGADLVDSLLS